MRSARSYTGRCCSGRCCPGCAGAWGSAWEEGVAVQSAASRPRRWGEGQAATSLFQALSEALEAQSRRARTVRALSLARIGMGSSTTSLPRHFDAPPAPCSSTQAVAMTRDTRVMLGMSTRRCMCSQRCHELASMDSTGFQ